MDRQALQALLLAVLCLVVVVFAAATLTETSDPGGGIGLGGKQDGTGAGGSGGGIVGDDADSGGKGVPVNRTNQSGAGGFALSICVTWLQGPGPLGAILLALVLLGGAVAYARNYVVSIGVLMIVGWPGLLLYLLLTSCGGGNFIRSGSFASSGSGDGGSSGSGIPGPGDAVADPTISTILLVLAGVLVVGVLVAFALGAGETDEEEEGDDGDGRASRFEMPDLAAVGQAAGDAADRIEDTDALDNEVYRAWREMTGHLNVESPQTSTPTEFRDAAVAAGMDPQDVSRLTDLFEEVRYGDAPITDEREREAVAVLRRIEDAYGEEDGENR